LCNDQTQERIDVKVGLSGRFKFDVRKPDGSIEELLPWFDNLITDGGLNRWGTGAPFLNCQVGTGTNQPAVGDTALQTLLATTTTVAQISNTAQSAPPYYQTVILQYTFPQGGVIGNIAEVGVGFPGGLWSRARIKDAGGVDTTITVVALDQLIVSYELRFNIPNVDVVTNQTIGGVSTTITTRAANVTGATWVGGGQLALTVLNSSSGFGSYGPTVSTTMGAYDGAIGAITSTPTGTSVQSSVVTRGAYSNNSLFVDLTGTFSIAQGNLAGGIDAVSLITYPGQWQMGFVPPIVKVNTQVLTVPFRLSWARGA
jgi:hypothetical protein